MNFKIKLICFALLKCLKIFPRKISEIFFNPQNKKSMRQENLLLNKEAMEPNFILL